MNGSVLASDKPVAKLARSSNAFEATRTKVALLNEQSVRVYMQIRNSEKKVVQVCEETKHRVVRLNAVLVGPNRAEKFMCSLVAESADVVDAGAQYLWHNTVD